MSAGAGKSLGAPAAAAGGCRHRHPLPEANINDSRRLDIGTRLAIALPPPLATHPAPRGGRLVTTGETKPWTRPK